jgi:predicted restriction endonuclease
MRHYPPRTTSTGNTSWGNKRDRATQARFRRIVLANASNQCQATQHDTRCPITQPLQAHHTEPGNNDPATGIALCLMHHKTIDPKAR